MLDWLEIRDFAIARHLELELQPGFTVLTGETGSGKSIVIDALSLLLGERADSGYIRHGSDKAEVQGSFSLTPDHPALGWLRNQELENGDECILRRVIQRNKTGRGYINGRAVPIATLRSLGNLLVDIHGQHEHQSLLHRETQREILDHQAGLGNELRALGNSYDQFTEQSRQLQSLLRNTENNRERAELLRFHLQELEALDPQPDEWQQLEQQHRKLGQLGELISAISAASEQLDGEEETTAARILAGTTRRLEVFRSYDQDIENALQLLAEADVQIAEAATLLRHCFEQNELDSQEIGRIEQRFSNWFELSRKHGIGPEALIRLSLSMQAELEVLTDPATQRETLEAALTESHKRYDRLAQKISTKRKRTAKRLSLEVTKHMQQLGMEGGEFQAVLHPQSSKKPKRYGNEQVEFLVTANPGQPLQAMTMVASGGELSRISLAIQVIAAGSTNVPTLVFDEVDVGIGGAVAHIVGQQLRQLSKSTQVLSVTHLAQVAANADQQLSVSKAQGKALTVIIATLDKQQRIEEIARMAGGSNLNPQSLAHAAAMLENAKTVDD